MGAKPARTYTAPALTGRKLTDLHGVGRSIAKDLESLGITSVEALAQEDGDVLYKRLSVLTGQRQDPCVLDTFRCAVAQAQNPNLPAEQCKWWWWSRRRLHAQGKLPT